MVIDLSELNIAHNLLINKLKLDLKQGVRMKSGQQQVNQKDIVRVWTDSRDWQFNVSASCIYQQEIAIDRAILESFGNSKNYYMLKIEISDNKPTFLDIEKLSDKFATFDAVDKVEAVDFFEGYLQSTFNRFLTQTLFNQMANSQDYQDWLIK